MPGTSPMANQEVAGKSVRGILSGASAAASSSSSAPAPQSSVVVGAGSKGGASRMQKHPVLPALAGEGATESVEALNTPVGVDFAARASIEIVDEELLEHTPLPGMDSCTSPHSIGSRPDGEAHRRSLGAESEASDVVMMCSSTLGVRPEGSSGSSDRAPPQQQQQQQQQQLQQLRRRAPAPLQTASTCGGGSQEEDAGVEQPEDASGHDGVGGGRDSTSSAPNIGSCSCALPECGEGSFADTMCFRISQMLALHLERIDKRLARIEAARGGANAPRLDHSSSMPVGLAPSTSFRPVNGGAAHAKSRGSCSDMPAKVVRMSNATAHHSGSRLTRERSDSVLSANRSLDRNVRRQLDLRNEWMQDIEDNTYHISLHELADSILPELSTAPEHEDHVFISTEKALPFVVLPASRFRLAWDLISLMMIISDMVTLPFFFAWPEMGESTFFDITFMVVLIWWTIDIPISFITAYYYEGVNEVRLMYIATHYLRTWFFMDLGIVAIDWLGLIAESSDKGLTMVRMGKTLRMLRILRSVRLLRLLKLRKLIETLQDSITSEYFHILLGILKLTVFILILNHWVACTWWFISADQDEDSPRWSRSELIATGTVWYQYFSALHWSLTQFTPASMEIVPQNTPERMFNVIVILFALIVFSSFVSSITAAMTSLRKLTSMFDKNFSLLRRYLRDRKIPAELTVRILRYAENRVREQKTQIQESDVILLRLLSRPLQMELTRQTLAPIITRHPFFARMAETEPAGMQLLCSAAVTSSSLSTGDKLFTEASAGAKMYFVSFGRLNYYPTKAARQNHSAHNPMTTPRKSKRRTTVHPQHRFSVTVKAPADMILDDNLIEVGEWFCEAALWTSHWAHLGTVRAERDSEVLAIDAQAFTSIACSYKRIAGPAQRYAVHFITTLNETFDAETAENAPTDLCITTYDEIYRAVESAFAPQQMEEESDEEEFESDLERHAGSSARSAGVARPTLSGPMQTPVAAWNNTKRLFPRVLGLHRDQPSTPSQVVPVVPSSPNSARMGATGSQKKTLRLGLGA